MTKLRRRLTALLLTLLMLLTPLYSVHALTNQQKQIKIKAAFVFQMSKFINWPYQQDQPITFCTVKNSRSYSVFTVLSAQNQQGKLKTHNRQILLEMRNEAPDLLSTYQDCALIYFHPDIEDQLSSATLTTLSKTKLVIGNSKTFIAKGGLTAIVTQDGKNKLFINRLSYEQSRIKIRSRLMSLARLYPQ